MGLNTTQSSTTLRLPTQDSSTGRGLKTLLQVIVGFAVGLGVTVWTIPGVPLAVIVYLQQNLPMVLLTAGIPAGITSFLWNCLRKDIPTY